MKKTSCLDRNSKTIRSLDFTTDCPKRRAGNPCVYCYVECSRRLGCNAKLVHDYRPYAGEIMKLTNEEINELNACGGLRLFSFGDYMPEHHTDVTLALNDAWTRGLKVKAITKQVNFIDEFHNHPALVMIHVSIDNVGHGIDWRTAYEYRNKYPKVRIRCAVMKDEDVPAMHFADIFTLNHSAGLKQHGFKMYSHKGREKLVQSYPMISGKMCCNTGRCLSCALKCGL
jgi:hypothetical protein